MEVLEVNSKHYSEVFSKPSHVFNSAAFNAINAYKSEQVYYLLFKDTKVRLGIIFGLRENKLYAPFSAPFAGFETLSEDIRLTQIDAALIALHEWAIEKKIKGIKITPPSSFYSPNFLNKIYNCLTRAGYALANINLNHHFPIYKLNEGYQEILWYNAKKNLKKALNYGLTFEKIANKDGAIAYEIIVQNRAQRGFPLRMTWEEVLKTMDIIAVDVFLVKKGQENIASAFVFHVTKEIVQIVFWGDLPQFSEYKTMNFISYNVFNYYKEQGKSIVDIGISTEDSIPNNGLCEFKESIGCDILSKKEFYLKLESSSLQNSNVQKFEVSKTLRNIDAKEFNYFFPNDPNPFISEKFISLNATKVDCIVRLVEETAKVQMGLIAGIKDGVLHSPFSAPFGGFHCKVENIYTSAIESFIQNLIVYAQTEKIKEMNITLPPDIYCHRSNAKIVNTLIRFGFKMQLPDITNCVNLRDFNNVYTHNTSRTYYNQAVNKKLNFSAATAEDQEEIYQIISENRTRKGRSIYMTFDDILKTRTIFPTDFFKVLDVFGKILAGAILFRAHEEIVYALFWGDNEKGRQDRAMDFLIFNLLSHYKEAGYAYIDLGISTEDGNPNEGLLRFKETHECISSLRYRFTWTSEKKR